MNPPEILHPPPFGDVKKSNKGMTKKEKDIISPDSLHHDGFAYTRKNNNPRSVQYYCSHKVKGDCKAQLMMPIGKDGRGDITQVRTKNQHTRKCCAINGVDVNTYNYDGKRTPFQDITSAASNSIPNSTANSSNFDISPNKKVKLQQFNDVSIEVRIHTKELATENLGWLPAKIWMTLKGELDKRYDTSKGLGGWSGIREDQVKSLVKDARAELGLGDAISTVMDVPQYSQMRGTARPFVQYSSTMPNPQKSGEIIRKMVFGNPSLFGLLKVKQVDLFVDVTFSCCPNPFQQCLIIMVFNGETSSFVPVVYILMTHKNEHAYWEAFNRIVVLSDWKLHCSTFTSDFKRAMINELENQFGGPRGGTHVGCFFHLKQAWRRYMLLECNFTRAEIKEAMMVGGLDLLCILPQAEVATYGIPYLEQMYNFNASEECVAKWSMFWTYFTKQWMPILKSWNICIGNYGDIKEVVNWTNNSLESYNRKINALFPKKPSLIEFIEIMEAESRNQAGILDDYRSGKKKEREMLSQTIPTIDNSYHDFKKFMQTRKSN